MSRESQIKYYSNILKKGEILLLKSDDSFFNCHYCGSPLNVITGFSGSAGICTLEKTDDKNLKIKIFVDTRYHLLVDKQVYKDVEVYKADLEETFFDALKKCYKKNTIMHVCDDILLCDYLKFDKYFDLRKYSLKKTFLKNDDINRRADIFLVDSKIEQNDFSFKIEKLKSISSKISKMLVFNLDEISYLTNLRSYQMMYSSNFKSILYLDFKNCEYILFLDKIPKIDIPNLKYKKLDDFESFIQSRDDEIYFDYSQITLKNFLAIKKPVQISKVNLPLIASIKPLSVIEHLGNAFAKTDAAISAFKKRIKAGLSEYDLVQIFNEELIKNGAKALSFKTILALGENSASIHYSSYDKNKILKDESLILLDCGGYYEGGYATDITRTFYFGSKPKQVYKKIYTAVLKAFLMCYLSQENDARLLDKKARNYLSQFNDLGFYFNHGLGHGIGTSCHQNPPRLSISSKDTIKPYQAHSIEPGLYGKTLDGDEFGVRIENCVYSNLDYQKISLSKFCFEDILIDYSELTRSERDAVEIWQENSKNIQRN